MKLNDRQKAVLDRLPTKEARDRVMRMLDQAIEEVLTKQLNKYKEQKELSEKNNAE